MNDGCDDDDDDDDNVGSIHPASDSGLHAYILLLSAQQATHYNCQCGMPHSKQ
jgi:hypothetical protein